MNRSFTRELPLSQTVLSGSIPLGKKHTWTLTNSLKANPALRERSDGGKERD